MADQNVLGQLATSVQTATTVTSLALNPSINQSLPANYVLVVGYGTATTQSMTVSSSITAGANYVPITSTVSNANFAVGTLVGVGGGGDSVVVTSMPASTASTGTISAATVTSIPAVTVSAATITSSPASTVTVTASTVNAATVTLSGYSFANILTATTTVVKSGAGTLHTITFNQPKASEVWTIYDATTSSGTKIGTITLPGVLLQEGPTGAVYDLNFSTGLTITSSGTTDGTVSFR